MGLLVLAELRWILVRKTRLSEKNESSETASQHFFTQITYHFQNKRDKWGRNKAELATATACDRCGLEVGPINHQCKNLVTCHCRQRSSIAPSRNSSRSHSSRNLKLRLKGTAAVPLCVRKVSVF